MAEPSRFEGVPNTITWTAEHDDATWMRGSRP